MNKILYKFVIAFLICIIIFHIFPKSREGFNIKDISKISSDVQNISRVAKSLPTEIGDLNKTVDAKFQTFGKEVQKQTLDIVTSKLESVFIQIGDILNNGLVKPVLVLFKGIGEIFIQIFNILKMIAYKIISLPNCIMPYVINETGNVINMICRAITPKFLRSPLSFIYKYTFGIVFGLISSMVGWENVRNNCYGFNVGGEIQIMNKQLANINKSFTKDFGNLDFSKISI